MFLRSSKQALSDYLKRKKKKKKKSVDEIFFFFFYKVIFDLLKFLENIIYDSPLKMMKNGTNVG